MHSRNKKLLVIDDEEDILEFLKVILEDEGYLVVTTDKDDYMEDLQYDSLPDLILLDLLLSGKDGRDIVKYLKLNESTKHIPVVMFSAHPGAREITIQAGADDFISKPFEIDLLLQKVAQYLQ